MRIKKKTKGVWKVDSFIIMNEHRKNGKKNENKFAKYFFIFVASALQVICLHVFFLTQQL